MVLFILAVAVSILLPRLPGLSTSRKNAALRRLAADAQATYEDALFRRKSLALIYQVEEHVYAAGQWDDEGRDYNPGAEGLPVKETRLPEGLRFQDVETSLDGMVNRGRALTRFLPQGYATPTWVHLEDDRGEQYTVRIHPLLGRVEILDGRIEAD